MTDISLIEFFRTGRFGPVELGMTRPDILEIFGKPDNYGVPPRHYMRAGFWNYGDIEFHFHRWPGGLFLI